MAVAPAVAAPAAWAHPAQATPAWTGGEQAVVGTNRFARGAAHELEKVRAHPHRLRTFLLGMPKGADLHNHLSGAVRTQILLGYGIAAGMCVDTSMTAVPGPCSRVPRPPADTARARPLSDTAKDRQFRNQVIGAWSMHGFREHHGETGHDHFFSTFDKFGPTLTGHSGDMLAAVARDTYRNGALYLETLVGRQTSEVRALAQSIGYDPDLEALRKKILASPQWPTIVANARKEIADQLAGMRRDLRCGTARAERACRLQVRFDHQVLRGQAPEVVFAQLLLGFELAEIDPAVVGVNLVQPEDGPISLRDYSLHMHMLDNLRHHYHKAHITLHAGELTPRWVNPRDLAFHVREAVLVGHVERIGHGVDIWWEHHQHRTLRTMARHHVLVEILLTSNRQILNVKGRAHPLRLYRASKVPIALATDDPGVEWTDLTGEYERGVTQQGMDYYALKHSARAALDHGFLQEKSLWRAPDDFRPTRACRHDAPWHEVISRSCARLLAHSPKAKAEWTQEYRFFKFEQQFARHWHGRPRPCPRASETRQRAIRGSFRTNCQDPLRQGIRRGAGPGVRLPSTYR
ncbi:adenosine deaminase [Streptantibioticus ferralitis]|uniref:adenosine deaminase n=1 Tax=Streptantibioticus ferralitis TaxID=236510 RepID=A0ABT5ZD48_9ACTN|nr:adenosine deaminase [Streptantibioticus ferralitis]MDF2261613.1 adenosine deaminase [Streptantibioticus ferralitis]